MTQAFPPGEKRGEFYLQKRRRGRRRSAMPLSGNRQRSLRSRHQSCSSQREDFVNNALHASAHHRTAARDVNRVADDRSAKSVTGRQHRRVGLQLFVPGSPPSEPGCQRRAARWRVPEGRCAPVCAGARRHHRDPFWANTEDESTAPAPPLGNLRRVIWLIVLSLN